MGNARLGGASVPETPEIETDKLDEKIHEELEHSGGSLLKAIALSTALFAAFAAVAALRAGSTVNEALVLKTEATRLQGEASDNWAAYQAKGIKSAVQQASESSWIALGKQPPSSFAEERQRYAREQVAIVEVAREKETERDKKSAEADRSGSGGSTNAGTAGLVRIDSDRAQRRCSLYRD
jgi:hypothetical protein